MTAGMLLLRKLVRRKGATWLCVRPPFSSAAGSLQCRAGVGVQEVGFSVRMRSGARYGRGGCMCLCACLCVLMASVEAQLERARVRAAGVCMGAGAGAGPCTQVRYMCVPVHPNMCANDCADEHGFPR